MHLADAFIQSDLHCIQVTVSTFYQLLLSLGIEPMILALLTPCSTSWATGKLTDLQVSILSLPSSWLFKKDLQGLQLICYLSFFIDDKLTLKGIDHSLERFYKENLFISSSIIINNKIKFNVVYTRHYKPNDITSNLIHRSVLKVLWSSLNKQWLLMLTLRNNTLIYLLNGN